MFRQVVAILACVPFFICFSEADTKGLARPCVLDKGNKTCGNNAYCSPVSINTNRTGLGVCWCKSEAYREPATLSVTTRTSLQKSLGSRYWTDCVPLLRIGDQCTPASNVNTGSDYNDGTSSSSNNTSPVLPDDAQCSSQGIVQCKPGRVAVGGYDCVPRASQAPGGAVGTILYNEPCSREKPCDSSKGLRCVRQSGQPVCKCPTGRWRDGVCSPISSHGDSCEKDSDCLLRGAKNALSSILVAMKCASSSGSDYSEGGGRHCQCPSVNGDSAAVLVGYIIPNTNAILPRNSASYGYDQIANVPIRRNLTSEKAAPVAYWCLNQAAFKFTPYGYLGACTLDLNEALAQKEIKYCVEGLFCQYFPVTSDDTVTNGRCIPIDPNDARWYGSEGKSDKQTSSSNAKQSSSQSSSSKIRAAATSSIQLDCKNTIVIALLTVMPIMWW